MGKGQQNTFQRTKVKSYLNIQKKTERTEGLDYILEFLPPHTGAKPKIPRYYTRQETHI